MKADDYLVIGGYESGIDALYQLNRLNKKLDFWLKLPHGKSIAVTRVLLYPHIHTVG